MVYNYLVEINKIGSGFNNSINSLNKYLYGIKVHNIFLHILAF